MEILYKKLYKLFVEELLALNIGYEYNLKRLEAMTMIVHAIDYIEHAHPTNEEILEIINLYEKV